MGSGSVTQKTGWSPDDADEHDDVQAGEEQAGQRQDERSTIELVQQVIEEGRTYAAIEVERQGLRAKILGGAALNAAILVVIALFLLIAAIVALLIGAIWALVPLVGVTAATGIVVGTALVVVVILALWARARVLSAIRLAFDGGEE